MLKELVRKNTPVGGESKVEFSVYFPKGTSLHDITKFTCWVFRMPAMVSKPLHDCKTSFRYYDEGTFADVSFTSSEADAYRMEDHVSELAEDHGGVVATTVYRRA